MGTKKKWSDLSSRQKAVVVGVGVVEVALTAVALRDLARRPAAGVRGPRALWALGCFVQPVGPVAYLAFARRSDD